MLIITEDEIRKQFREIFHVLRYCFSYAMIRSVGPLGFIICRGPYAVTRMNIGRRYYGTSDACGFYKPRSTHGSNPININKLEYSQ
jgi:hypothetical protein